MYAIEAKRRDTNEWIASMTGAKISTTNTQAFRLSDQYKVGYCGAGCVILLYSLSSVYFHEGSIDASMGRMELGVLTNGLLSLN